MDLKESPNSATSLGNVRKPLRLCGALKSVDFRLPPPKYRNQQILVNYPSKQLKILVK